MPDQRPVFQGDHPSNLIGWPTFQPSRLAWFSTVVNTPVHFCDSRSPWQRGSNEIANGSLRQYFPKGTGRSRYTPEHLKAVQDEINNRPRRVLGHRSPTELFTALPASPEPSTVATTRIHLAAR
jgi:hypothetical protein